MLHSSDAVRAEVRALLWVALSIYILSSLYSYHSGDPSFHVLTWKAKETQNWFGYAGSFLADLMLRLFGIGAFVIGFFCLARGLLLAYRRQIKPTRWAFLRGVTVVVILVSFIQIFSDTFQYKGNEFYSGGMLGMAIFAFLKLFLNVQGAKIVIVLATIISFIMFFECSLINGLVTFARSIKLVTNIMRDKITGFFLPRFLFSYPSKESHKPSRDNVLSAVIKHPENFELNRKSVVTSERSNDVARSQQDLIVTKEQKSARHGYQNIMQKDGTSGSWKRPNLDLLEDPPSQRIKVDQNEIKDRARILTEKLALFGVTGQVVAAHSGPAVTLYEYRPDSSVKISKITELADDLAMALTSESLRIIAPIPGKDVVGIETANKKRETVYLKDL
ncbi:MAG: DNA translocase FtsK 4TM domain-containing protein, partial [Bdellovibrionaceae bacterium]|nr:DNA translocase FtsK 4TM domain-containing protein [Pseudobdellovibrionaceae bacterium]MDW8190781.1 DNA translocase FtsK 4TM domain-containing protein [Pseudobdellovibrionaceae bacterium]